MIRVSNVVKTVIGVVLMVAMLIFINKSKVLFGLGMNFEEFQYRILYVYAIGVLVLLMIDRRLLLKGMYNALGICAIVAVPFIMMQLSMLMAGDSEYAFAIYMINVLLYFIPIVVFFIITNNLSVSATLAIVLGVLFNTTSYVLNNLRGTPFVPTDILAVGTAAKVVGNYEFTPSWELVSATVMTAFAIVMVWSFPIKLKYRRSAIINRCSAAVFLGIVVTVFSAVNFKNISMDVFDQYHANNTHGTAYSFFINCCKMTLEKPQGYNDKQILQMLNGMEEEPLPEEKPNIIVIMNESYADLKVVGDFKTNIPYNKFFMSLEKNTVRGNLIVSPFGGYTCNSEFEFLSGLSMGLLPMGGTPYLQYINKKGIYFLPEYMNSLGYTTIALHPYYARCWNRNTVYPLLGFDKFISIDNMDKYQDANQFEYMRSYMSDNTSYSALINQFETKKDDERLFLFNVTMQNHGGYTYGGYDFDNDVRITNMRGSYPQTEQYLSLIRRSDKALEILIDYFKNYKEPTVIVMFGDHQPGVELDFYEELYGASLDELSSEQILNRYKIPFIIWTNYEQESKSDVNTSLNYLSDYVLESAKLPKSKINMFHDTVKDDIPCINAQGHYDANGEWKANNVDASEALKKYQALEYFMLTHKAGKDETP